MAKNNNKKYEKTSEGQLTRHCNSLGKPLHSKQNGVGTEMDRDQNTESRNRSKYIWHPYT